MRSRLVIPAALLMAVAYAVGRRDAARPAAPSWWPAEPAPPAGPERTAAAETAATAAPAPAPPSAAATPPSSTVPSTDPAPGAPGELDLAHVAEWAATHVGAVAPSPPADGPDLALVPEWDAAPAGGEAGPGRVDAPGAPGPERVLESGRFTLGGWAAAPGHGTLCGITFRGRLPAAPSAERVRLVVEVSDNVPEGGVVVLGDAGFAPDAEGFALMAAAAAPGAFAVAGRYELLAA